MSGILFIELPSNMQKLQNIKTRRPQLGAPLPFIYIAPLLLMAGHEVHIIDMRVTSRSEFTAFLREKKPSLVGISIMPGNALPRAIGMNNLIKTILPSAKIVWGGSFPSLHYQLCMSIPSVDYVVCGDGEITMTELAAAVSDSRDNSGLDKISGLVYRDNGTSHTTEPRSPVNLDDMPVGAWHLAERYMPYYLGPRGYLAVCTARGCPYRCSFCYNNLLYRGFKRYRIKSIDTVLAEIDHIAARYKISKLQFMDDDYLGQKRRGFELMEAVRRKYPRMKFHIAARVAELSDEDTAKQLSRLGCESVFLGVESGSPEQLEQMKKGCTASDTLEAAVLCKKYGIIPSYSFTCGYPDETHSQLFANVEMAKMLKDIDPDGQSAIEIISPIAGTPLFDDLSEHKLLPEMNPAKWCYMTDWKSAKCKPWIKSQGFYEAYQLAFFLAFASRGHSSGMRGITRYLSAWSRRRLIDKKPGLLPEYRLMNYIVKKALWGLRG